MSKCEKCRTLSLSKCNLADLQLGFDKLNLQFYFNVTDSCSLKLKIFTDETNAYTSLRWQG